MNITVAHTQGGEVTGSIDESVRHAITKLAHIHFPATQESAGRLMKMGENPDTIYVTGCPAMDIVAGLAPFRMPSDIFSNFGITKEVLDPYKPFLLVLQHPVTTEFGDGTHQIMNTIDAVESIGMPTVWIWPNADAGTDDIAKGMRMHKEEIKSTNIHYFLNFTPEDYVYLLAHCNCIIGNSSSGIREGAFLGTPSVNIGSRQNNRERGSNVIDAGYNSTEIKKAILKQLEHGRYKPEYIFGEGGAGVKIAEVLSTITVKQQKTISY
jgi:UDP-hydrolysing UDP-N-acetyl-D-glucosamine 2-epimerase